MYSFHKHNFKRMIPVLLAAALLFSAGCTQKDPAENMAPPSIPQNGSDSSAAPTAAPAPTASPFPSPEPGVPNVIGLYYNDAGTRKLVAGSHTTAWTAGQDIKCYEAIASREPSIENSNFAALWNSYWEPFSNAKNTRIGYQIIIFLKAGGELSYDVRTPEDTQQNREYVETYLYDDVHQTPGEWYSHLEPDDVNAETIATSIKLTAGSKIGDIEKISLTAYLYTADLPQRIITQYRADILRA